MQAALLLEACDDVLMGPLTVRTFGYIYNGFGSIFWWREVLMKCMELLRVFLGGCVSIFQDGLFRLVLFTCCGAFCWPFLGAYKPGREGVLPILVSLGLVYSRAIATGSPTA